MRQILQIRIETTFFLTRLDALIGTILLQFFQNLHGLYSSDLLSLLECNLDLIQLLSLDMNESLTLMDT